MADERRVIYIEVNASKAEQGSAAATRALAAVEKSTASMGTSLDRMEASLNRAGTYLKAQFALMIANVASGFIQMAKESLAAAAGLDELADQLGITATGLQALQYAGVQAGIKMEQLETGISQFGKRMGEAAEGSREMVEALSKLGVRNLDLQGKLRPTEDLLQDVAKAILAIDGPARRAAAATEMFGKAGQKMLPLLTDIAGGMDTLAARARAAGVVISGEAIQKLDKLGDSAEVGKLKLRALFAENLAGPLTDIVKTTTKEIEWLVEQLKALDEWGRSTSIRDWFRDLTASGQGLGEAIGAGISGLPKLFADVFRSAMNEVIGVINEATPKIVGAINAWVKDNPVVAGFLGVGGGMKLPAPIAGIGGSATPWGDYSASVGGAYYRGKSDFLEPFVAPERMAANAGGFIGGVDTLAGGGGAVPRSTGARLSTVTGAGKAAEDAAKKYEKLKEQLTLTADAQDDMTAAARRGDVAFQDQEIATKAAQKAIEVYGKSLKDIDPSKLKEIEDLIRRDTMGKLAQSFVTGTNELQKQNELLDAEIRLMNEAPEVRARELAAIKTRNDALKAGSAITQEDIDNRLKAADIGERLKAQSEDLKRAQELWTEPLKSALQDIQSTAADAFEEMLESGKINFESLGQVFRKTITRMIAEFMALATVRPVMSVLVNAVSPSMAREFGLGGGSASGGGSSGGGFGMPSFGGGGSGFGFLSNPIFGSSYGAYNTAADVASLTGAPMASGFSQWANSLTWGQGLGAAAGFGMGAYQLATSKSTASTIGGIGSMVGSIVSLLPIPGAQIIGPLIGLASNIIPGLFGGDSKPVVTNQGYGQLSYGAGGFGTSGGAWGPNANAQSLQGPLGQMGQTIQGLFDLLGGVKDASRVWGVALESMSQGNGDWQFDGQTSFLVGPNGEKRQWGMGSNDADIGMATAGAKAAISSILDGAVGDITDNLRKALENIDQTEGGATLEQLGQTIAEIETFDDAVAGLGKTVTGAEQALKAIDDSFAGLLATAEKYDLDTAAVDAAKVTARTKVATDFADGLQRALDDMVDPTKGLLADLDAEHKAAIETNNYIVENVTGALDQIAKIEELYGKKRADIVEASLKEQHDAFWARSQFLFTEGLALADSLKAMNDDTLALSANPMATAIKGYGSDRDQFIRGVGDTFGVGSTEYYDATIAAYGKFNAQMKAANDDFLDGLTAMTDALEGPGVANIRSLMKQRGDEIAEALALDGPFYDGLLKIGPAVKAATKAWDAVIIDAADTFKDSIEIGLLEFTDPLQALINANDKARDEALATAEANNEAISTIYGEKTSRLGSLEEMRRNDLYSIKEIEDAADVAGRALTDIEAARVTSLTAEAEAARLAAAEVESELAAFGNHWTSLLDVEELYLKKEKKLKEDYYEQTLSSLEDIIKRLTYGDLSGASPTLTLEGTRGAYQASLAQARAGDTGALEDLSGLAADYATEARNYYASSADYYRITEEIRSSLQGIDSAIRGGSTNEAGATPLPAVSAADKKKDEQIASLIAAMDKMLVQQEQINALLKRAVIYS